MDTKELPPYITRDGELLAVQPIDITLDLYMFMIDADWDALKDMCDRYLNLGGPTVYRPMLPWVIFYCSSVNNRAQKDPIGWCPEKDFGFWIPVVAGHLDGPIFKAERFLTFTPYIYVDNGVALIGGRTMFGFPKEIGVMSMPAQPTDPAVFTVDTQVVPVYSPDSEVVWRRLVECSKLKAGLWDELKTLWTSGEHFIEAIAEILQQHGPGRIPELTPEAVLQFFKDLQGRNPMVFLKQFPDAVDGTKACYQAIVESPVVVKGSIKGGYMPGEYGITFHEYESHQLVKNMGLKYASKDGNKYLCKSLIQGWSKFDAVVEAGKIIWQTT